MLGLRHTGIAQDEISQTLGDSRYIDKYYIHELRESLLGPHDRNLIGVSRFYRWRLPQVVVDFEPSPLEGKFFCEEKRRYCHEQGIVYVPIFLRERLTASQFAQRVKQEHSAMDYGRRVAKEDATLRISARVAPAVREQHDSAESGLAEIEREALRRLAAEIAKNTHLRGASRMKRLHRIKLTVQRQRRSQRGRKRTDSLEG